MPTQGGSSQSADGGTKDPDAIRLSLLDAAVDVFGEKGFENARVAEIARRCDLTTGAIFARWPTKRDLFVAAVEHVVPRLRTLGTRTAEMSVAEALEYLGTDQTGTEDHRLRSVMLEAFAAARRDAGFSSHISQAVDAEAAALAALVDEGKASGIVDGSLSTDAIVLLYRALNLGIDLARAVPSSGVSQPGADEWNALVGRILGIFVAEGEDES